MNRPTVAHSRGGSIARPQGFARPLRRRVNLPLSVRVKSLPADESEALARSPKASTSGRPAETVTSAPPSPLPSDASPSPAPAQPDSSLQTLIMSLIKSPHDPEIMALAIPALLSLASDPLLSLVDTAFVGHLDYAPALAALGLNTTLFGFSFVIFNFLATAVTPAIAKAAVRNEKHVAGKLVWQATVLSLTLGLLLAVGLVSFSVPALTVMGLDTSDAELTQLSRDYLIYRAIAAPAVLFSTVGQGTLRGLKDMKEVLKVTTVANLINLTLDPLLIFGLHWGVGGAAIATSAAQYTAAAMYAQSIFDLKKDQLGLWPPPPIGSPRAIAADLKPFVEAAGAVLARTSALLGVRTIASISASHLGVGAIAAHSIVLNLWALFSMITDSLAVSAQALVAAKIGEGRPQDGKSISQRLLQLGFALGSTVALAYFVGHPNVPGLFTQDQMVEDAMNSVLPIAFGMLPICGLVYVMDGIFVGVQEFNYLAQAMYISAGATLLALTVVEPLDLGLRGIWVALSTLMLVRGGTLAYGYVSRLPWSPSRAAEPFFPPHVDPPASSDSDSPRPSGSGQDESSPSSSAEPPSPASASSLAPSPVSSALSSPSNPSANGASNGSVSEAVQQQAAEWPAPKSANHKTPTPTE